MFTIKIDADSQFIIAKQLWWTSKESYKYVVNKDEVTFEQFEEYYNWLTK